MAIRCPCLVFTCAIHTSMAGFDNESITSDEDYDVISNPAHRSLESSIADLALSPSAAPLDATGPAEPPPTDIAKTALSTVSLSPAEIQAYVVNVGMARLPPGQRVRVYVDGVFDGLTAGTALKLRQAKLSFPRVHLVVGVFSDDICAPQSSTSTPLAHYSHAERCEVVRACRWVDEVHPSAPWLVDQSWLSSNRIDYVALEEGSSIDPTFDKERLKAYDALRRLGRVIPTRRTMGLTPARPLSRALPTPPVNSPPVVVQTPVAPHRTISPPPNTATGPPSAIGPPEPPRFIPVHDREPSPDATPWIRSAQLESGRDGDHNAHEAPAPRRDHSSDQQFMDTFGIKPREKLYAYRNREASEGDGEKGGTVRRMMLEGEW